MNEEQLGAAMLEKRRAEFLSGRLPPPPCDKSKEHNSPMPVDGYEILALLREMGPTTANKISERIDLSSKKIGAVLSKLSTMRFAEKIELQKYKTSTHVSTAWVYQAVEKGFRYGDQ